MALLDFVRVDDIIESFEQLVDSIPEEGQPITDTFDTYICQLQRLCRCAPIFTKITCQNIRYHAEGWHQRMHSNIDDNHPKYLALP